jgi:hypothetical protein
MFASIPKFIDFYSEDVNKGIECIRLLNEIVGTVITLFSGFLRSYELVNLILYCIIQFIAKN